ncbi:MAG: hypothetical protein M1821_008479 [Bathelium mastoideum]|nr:MAG: hypothetical protein M1821_008479 [Bathelium mastoideum]
MLNDVLSLCVGLWAVKVANEKKSSKMYTYGWQRAETLGALVNGVFLVALCLSIFLEAIQRFVEPQEVSRPMLVLIVGCCGLASNILGLFLFHEHSHGPGGHGHDHEHGHADHGHAHGEEGDLTSAEEGISPGVQKTIDAVADEGGNVVDVLPQSRIGNWPQTQSSPKDTSKVHTRAASTGNRRQIAFDDTTPLLSSGRGTPNKRRRSSGSRAYSALEENIPIHPRSFRDGVISASRFKDDSPESSNENTDEEAIHDDDATENSEDGPLLKKDRTNGSASSKPHRHAHHHSSSGLSNAAWHKDHRHAKPKQAAKAGGHSHGDLNMRGVFLHVLGDALGNVGVIASALVIWLTRFSWRFYADPAISLVITVVILGSAIPLCKAASRILLQAVPEHLSIDDIKADIERLPGIISCHHLHVWQLTDTTLIASLHVQVAFDFKGEGSRRYMALARGVRKCLHEYGIHSSTIQPEFCLDPGHEHSVVLSEAEDEHDERGSGSGTGLDGTSKVRAGSKQGSVAGSVCENANACLLECDDDCGDGKKCCSGRRDSEGH